MKKFLMLTLIVSLCSFSFAADEETKVADRVQAAADVLNDIQGAPDKGIPQEVLGSAECVAVVPSMLKGGFIVGAKYGRGLASCRTPKDVYKRQGLDGGQKDGVEGIVGEHGELVDALRADGAGVGGGEGEEDVSGAVAGVAAVAAEAEGNFFGDALELRGNERSVGGDDDDDGADVFSVGGMLGNFFADGNAGDAEFGAASVVALDEDADGISAGCGVEHAGGGADAALEFIADHAGATAHVAFFDGAGVGGVERVEGVFGMDVESVDAVSYTHLENSLRQQRRRSRRECRENRPRVHQASRDHRFRRRLPWPHHDDCLLYTSRCV